MQRIVGHPKKPKRKTHIRKATQIAAATFGILAGLAGLGAAIRAEPDGEAEAVRLIEGEV